jgi:hypothetical protein
MVFAGTFSLCIEQRILRAKNYPAKNYPLCSKQISAKENPTDDISGEKLSCDNFVDLIV